MKHLFAFLLFFSCITLHAQTYDDAVKWYNEALDLNAQGKTNESMILLEKAAPVFKKENQWKYYAICECAIGGSAAMNYELEKSEKVFNRSLATIEKNLDPKAPELGTCYGLYSLLLVKQGKPKEALQMSLKSYNIRITLFPEGHPLLLELEKTIAAMYLDNQKPDSSLIWAKKALKSAEGKLGANDPMLADIYNNMGNAYDELAKENEAIEYHNKALEIRKNIDPNSLDVALSYGNLALAYADKGDFSEAEKFQLQALDIRKKILPAGHYNLYLSYSNLAALYGEMDKFTESLKYLELMKPIVEKNYNNTVESADFYLNYGAVLEGLERYEQAYPMTQKALKIFTQYFGEKHPKVATCYQNLGLLELSMGNPDKCIELQKKSIEIRDLLYGKNHITTSGNHLNMGNAYMGKGITATAAVSYLKSYDIVVKAYGATHPNSIKALENISVVIRPIDMALCLELWKNNLTVYPKESIKAAEALIQIGNTFLVYTQLDSAESYYVKAEQIYKKNNQESESLNNSLGALYLGQKKYDLSYQKFKTLTQNPQVSRYNLCKYLNNLAMTCLGLKKWDEALQYSQQALVLSGKNIGQNIYDIPTDWKQIINISAFERSIRTKIEAFAKKGMEMKSKKDLETSVQLAGFLQNFHQKYAHDKIISGEMGTANAETFMGAYLLGIQSSYELFLLNKDAKHLQECLQLSERTRGFLLAHAIQNYKALRVSGVPESVIQEEAKYAELQGTILKKSLTPLNETEAADMMNLLQTNQSKRDSLYKRLERDYPTYVALKNPAYRSATEIQKQLKNDEAIISYLMSETDFLTLVTTQSQVIVKSQPLHSNLKNWIEKFRTGIERNSYKIISENAWNIYQYVFANIDIFLQEQKINKLIILPEGPLYFVPFEALLTSAPANDGNFGNLNYLIKKYQISYAYTANLYFDSRRKPIAEPSHDYIAIAPVFSSKSAESTVRSSSPMKTEKQYMGEKTRDFLSDGTHISALPGTLEEVNQVSELFKNSGKKYKTLINAEANEKQVKTSDLKNYRYLHFATHGFVNELQPSLSGLILAQQEPSEDNILHSVEVYGMQLNADLLVLSACQTGLGVVEKGEGLVGLGRGFLYAGVRNMVVSLWSVSDAATAKLMVDFFNTHNKNAADFQTSMHQAKLELMKNPNFASPFFWAPFILIGK